MSATFLHLLLLTSYVLHTLRPDRVPTWHLYLLCVLCVIEALFAAADRKGNDE